MKFYSVEHRRDGWGHWAKRSDLDNWANESLRILSTIQPKSGFDAELIKMLEDRIRSLKYPE